MFPALRFFGNTNYKNILLARKLMKDQMDPYTEKGKVDYVSHYIYVSIETNRQLTFFASFQIRSEYLLA